MQGSESHVHALSTRQLVFFFFFKTYFLKFIYFWLHWLFAAVWGFSLVAASGATLRHDARLLIAMGCGLWVRVIQWLCHGGSVVVLHAFSCFSAGGIFLDQGWNLCALHWQVDSQPLWLPGKPDSWSSNHIVVLRWKLISLTTSGQQITKASRCKVKDFPYM